MLLLLQSVWSTPPYNEKKLNKAYRVSTHTHTHTPADPIAVISHACRIVAMCFSYSLSEKVDAFKVCVACVSLFPSLYLTIYSPWFSARIVMSVQKNVYQNALLWSVFCRDCSSGVGRETRRPPSAVGATPRHLPGPAGRGLQTGLAAQVSERVVFCTCTCTMYVGGLWNLYYGFTISCARHMYNTCKHFGGVLHVHLVYMYNYTLMS